VKNRDKQRKLGIPHTLGVCLHGCPGSGKTSAIKAFCAERSKLLGSEPVHLFVINVSLVNDVKVLREVLLAVYVNDIYVPHDWRVYVLEEIDCNGWKHIV
jgi:SpoVK/Ycf46/Vps4 family AAA+-type ATPase